MKGKTSGKGKEKTCGSGMGKVLNSKVAEFYKREGKKWKEEEREERGMTFRKAIMGEKL